MTLRDLAALRAQVLEANQRLARSGLAPFTFGNASAIDRDAGLVVIKPSGVPYEGMTVEDLVVTDLDGGVVEGTLRPSSDLSTHLVLYRAFSSIGGVVHTHSHYATAWAQARRPIPCLGTTHADYFDGPIPVTGTLQRETIEAEYEANTGKAIVDCALRSQAPSDPMRVPAMLVANHGSFCWGLTVGSAVETAAVLEEVARLAYHTVTLQPDAEPILWTLRDKHFSRKHGPAAYYGQVSDGSPPGSS